MTYQTTITHILKPTKDILDLAGKYKPKKIISALKTRELFEKKYDRN